MKQWQLRGITSDLTLNLEPVRRAPPPDEDLPLRALVDQFPGVVWTTDRDMRVTSILGRGLAVLGLGPNQLVGTNLRELVDDSEATVAHARALLGDTVPFSLRLGGRHLKARVAPLSDASGRTLGVIGLAFDTARIRPAEQDIASAEALPA